MPRDPTMTQATAYLDRALAVRARARASSLGRSLSGHLTALLLDDLAASQPGAAASPEPQFAAALADLRSLVLSLDAVTAALRKEHANGYGSTQHPHPDRPDGANANRNGEQPGHVDGDGRPAADRRHGGRGSDRHAQPPVGGSGRRNQPPAGSSQFDLLGGLDGGEG
jgi:hypothetical protein